MICAEFIAEYRRRSQDLAEPYFCDDAEVMGFVSEAQDEAAIRSRLIVAEEEIGIEPGESRYPIPDGMFDIESAELVDTAGRCYQITAETAGDLDILTPGWRRKQERPEYFVLEDKTIRIGSVPDAAYTLRLFGHMTPRNRIESADDTPEIHAANHSGLIAWVMFRAFSKIDADLFDPQRAAIEEARFTQQFGKRPSADLRKRQNANRPHRNRVYL